MLFGLMIFASYFYYLDRYYAYYKKQFKKSYSYVNNNNIQYNNIMENLYSQNLIKILVNKSFIILILGVFLSNLGACPLLYSSLALLIENSTNEHISLENYRKFNFFLRGCAPLFAVLFIVNLNCTTLSYILLFILSLILFISSFFILNESMRFYYEYCEWNKLSDFIMKNFKLEEQKDIQFLNNIELKLFQRKENEIINKEYEIRRLNLKAETENDEIFEKNNFFNYYKRKKSFLIRGIRKNSEIITKYKEIKYNPSILIICLKANRHYIKTKYLLFSILILINFFLFILQEEMTKKPFLREKELYFSKGQNYLLNSNYFGIFMINYISNIFFYFLYRISCFKIVIIFCYIIL